MARLAPESFKIKDGTEVLLRSYEPGDESLAQRFTSQVAAESTHTLKYEGVPEMPKDKLAMVWAEINSHPIHLNFGAFLDGRIVGNLRFFQRNSNHPWTKHVVAFGMAVSRDYWGHGIGKRMLQLMEAHARKCGIIRIEAEVRSNNDRGLALYKNFGFNIKGKREKAAFIDGKYLDEFYIGKILF